MHMRSSAVRECRLAMVLLVCDEADIVEATVRYHAGKGVDTFVVMDNASRDGTVEILEKLAGEVEIRLLHESTRTYRQSAWTTKLAHVARREFGADVVIAGDADEFWIPRPGSALKQIVAGNQAVTRYERFNMLPDPELPFYQSVHCATATVAYRHRAEVDQTDLSVILKKPAPKVVVKTRGLIKIKGGNHGAWHLRGVAKPRLRPEIEIFHYPIRSHAQFAASVALYREIAASNARAAVGAHWRRWAALKDEEEILQEYQRMAFSRSELTLLYKLGVVSERTRPRAKIAPLFNARPTPQHARRARLTDA